MRWIIWDIFWLGFSSFWLGRDVTRGEWGPAAVQTIAVCGFTYMIWVRVNRLVKQRVRAETRVVGAGEEKP